MDHTKEQLLTTTILLHSKEASKTNSIDGLLKYKLKNEYENVCNKHGYVLKDSVNIKINCNDSIAKELNQFFTFTVPNYQYTPAYKNKKWDGLIRLFNLHSHKLYVGLLDYLIKFAKDRNYTIEHDTLFADDIDDHDIESFITGLPLGKIKLYDYQIRAITHAIKKQRCLLVSPTGSGKSLIIYSLI